MTVALSLWTGIPIAIPIGAAKEVVRTGRLPRWGRCTVGSSERTPSVVSSVSFSSRPGPAAPGRPIEIKWWSCGYRTEEDARSNCVRRMAGAPVGAPRTNSTAPVPSLTSQRTDGAWQTGRPW